MGYLKNEAILVSGWDDKRVKEAHESATAIFDSKGMGGLVGGIVPHAVNGGAAFLIAPDGSKEGWEQSDVGDALRQEFIAYLRGEGRDLYLDWCLILIGGDSDEYRVLDSPNCDGSEGIRW